MNAGNPGEQGLVLMWAMAPGGKAEFVRVVGEIKLSIAAHPEMEFDGVELPVGLNGEATVYIYGPDADALLRVVRPHVLASECRDCVRATLRYGDVEDESARVVQVDFRSER